MALYYYQAFTKDGKKITGTVDASSVAAVREQLIKMGHYPIKIEVTKEAAKGIPWYKKLLLGRVSLKDKILFTKQLAVLLRAGVPLLQALELLIEQFPGRLKSILIDVKDGVKGGRSFADGLTSYPKVFSSIYVQLVRAGEASGNLEVILDRLVEYMERRAEVIKKVKAALRYPMIQLAVVGLVVVALVTVVVPNFAEQFEERGADLPWTTQLLMAISNFFLSYYLIIIGVLIGLIVLYRWWRSTPTGALMIDRIKLKIPILRYFTQMGSVVQFSQTLGMLTESGVNLAESLDIVVKIIDNRILKNTLSEARDKIVKQGKIAEYLEQTKIFPPMATYLIKTGEESGQLGQMLLTVAQNYESDLSEYSEGLSATLEPIMLLVMAVIVGFIVISIAQPMMEFAGAGFEF